MIDFSENENTNVKFDILKLNRNYKPRNSNKSKNSIENISLARTTDKARTSLPTITDLKFSKENLYGRIDNYGNEIKKGSKEHKVCFIDEISNKKIAEVIMIDNVNISQKKENIKTKCECQTCLIL